jgi:hypothetical protein
MTSRAALNGIAACVLLTLLASCGAGNKNANTPRTDLRPFKEVSAVEMFEEVLGEAGLASERKSEITIVGFGPWKVDLWIEGMPLVIEYLTADDRAKLGDNLTSSKVGEQFKLIAVATEEIEEGEQLTSANSRYCVVFDDRDYVYQPNPTSEDRYDITIFEIEKRIRKDAVDVIEELRRIMENLAAEADEDADEEEEEDE